MKSNQQIADTLTTGGFPHSPVGAPRTYPGDARLRERDERLDALKQLIDHLAHDFNNMLVPLVGYVTLLREELAGQPTALKYTARLEQSARKTEGLLESVLLAVRPQRRFNPQAGDLGAVLERTLLDWNGSIPGTAQIRVEKLIQSCPWFFDEALWISVFLQLLSNARFGLATGGTVEVTLRPTVLSLERSLALNVPAKTFELTVRDTGFGMTPDVLRRACEPFFSTRPKGQGTGLGLTIVHSIVQLHGGQVDIESQEEAGTTVRIWVPAEAQPAVPAEAILHRHGGAASERTLSTVLVIDDDPMVREVVKAHLQRLSLEVLVAQDGIEGLKLFQRHAREVSLVISDVNMPRMSGLELYENIRKISPAVRVIWVSGDAEATREPVLARFGPERPALIRKPFTLKSFTETVLTQLG